MSEARLHTPPVWDVPGHEVRKVLKHAPDQGRTVLLTRYGTIDCVTRVWHATVSVHQHEYLHRIAAGHATASCPFPPDLVSDLEGYRVRASLGRLRWLPEVVNVGLVRDGLNAEARPYISTRWIEGRPLHATWRGYDLDSRKRILREILRALDALHARNVLHGDIKAENIVVSDGSVTLIDLDTMREVPDRNTAVPVSQLTALYSAPEQSHDREAYLASDLFAYGVMVGLLLANSRPGQQGYPPKLDGPWGTVLEACLREKPQDRPAADELLRAVTEEGKALDSIDPSCGKPVDTVTVRVPDSTNARRARVAVSSSLTERVADARDAPPPPRRARLRRRSIVDLLLERMSWRGAALGVLVMLLLGATLWLPRLGRGNISQASGLRAQLQRHKTDLASNNRIFLALIVTEARGIAHAGEVDEAWGVYALARVWQQGWQYTGAAWDPGMFSEGDALTGEALDMAATPEALLARAILTGAACRLGPRAYARRADHCAESRLRTQQALRHIDADWLRVEALWNAALVERAEAARSRDAGRDREARRHIAAGLEHCDAARAILPASPINAVELGEECIVIASRARDAVAWVWWVHWVLGHGDQAGKDPSRLAGQVFRSADPSCAEQSSDALQARYVRPGQGTLEYCAYVANMALGCPERAALFVCPKGATPPCELPAATAEVPWDFASLVAQQAGERACAIP